MLLGSASKAPRLSFWAVGYPIIYNSFPECLGECLVTAHLSQVALRASAFVDHLPSVQNLGSLLCLGPILAIRRDRSPEGPSSDVSPWHSPRPASPSTPPEMDGYNPKLKPAESSPAGMLDGEFSWLLSQPSIPLLFSILRLCEISSTLIITIYEIWRNKISLYPLHCSPTPPPKWSILFC